ncbi:hypothetical protein BJX99DRAFT_255198 [Aspergillus californicus]
MFSPLIEYGKKYRSVRGFFLNPDFSEGCGKPQFSTGTMGSFTHNLCWTDGLIHFASLVLHANLSPRDSARGIRYMVDGWESLRIAKQLSSKTPYSIYARMDHLTKTNLLSGDVYLFGGEDIIPSCFGISFHAVNQLQPVLPDTQQSRLETPVTPVTPVTPTTPDLTGKCDSHHDILSNSPISERSSSPQPSTVSKLEERALEIVSQEVSIDVTELEENMNFSRLGVDSLLSTSVVDKLSRETTMTPASPTVVACASSSVCIIAHAFIMKIGRFAPKPSDLSTAKAFKGSQLGMPQNPKH